MSEVGFVTAGNNHRATIAGTKVRQRDEDVDLSAHEATVVIPELISMDGRVSPGVQSNRFSGTAECSKVLVYK